MSIQVQVYENVTPGLGACIYVEVGNHKLLLDCGLKKITNQPIQFPFDPKKIDAVIISHGHLGHCGLLPELCMQGYKGPIYGTHQTRELARLSIAEAAFICREKEENSNANIFYSTQDVQNYIPHFHAIEYYNPIALCNYLTIELYDASHVAGSAIVKLIDTSDSHPSSLLYMADVGSHTKDLSHPEILNSRYEIVIVSSLEKPKDSWQINRERIAAIINETADKSGNILFSVFSSDQREKIVTALTELTACGKIKQPLFIFLDTPALEECQAYLASRQIEVGAGSLLKLIGPQDMSKALNTIEGTVIIISGMRHQYSDRMAEHFRKNLPDPDNAIIFVGNQLDGTPNGQIQQGGKVVKLKDQDCPIAASIYTLYDPDLHLDRQAFTAWLSSLKTSPRLIELTH